MLDLMPRELSQDKINFAYAYLRKVGIFFGMLP